MSMFLNDITGTLMQITPSMQTRYEFDVWFPFTRNAMNIIKEGAMLAVKNFSSNKEIEHFSVLRITSVLPHHYAMGDKLSGYPGFLEEAITSASKDWEQEKPTEDTTKIVCKAIPSFFEIKTPSPLSSNQTEPKMLPESNLPMTGEKTYLLNEEWTEYVVNHDLQKLNERTIDLGTLANSEKVTVKALWDNLIQTHFGIFAYTNAGKSNLLSTTASKILDTSNNVKIVIYDLMGEYGALLIDCIHNSTDATIVCMSENTLPDSVMKFWQDDKQEHLEKAAKDIVNTTILPKNLQKYKEKMEEPVKKILKDGKIKLFVPSDTLGIHMSPIVENLPTFSGGASSSLTRFFATVINDNQFTQLSSESITTVIQTLNNFQPTGGPTTQTMQNAIDEFIRALDKIRNDIESTSQISDKYKISLGTMIEMLNLENKKSLFVIQGSDDSTVRNMSHQLGKKMLETRRTTGKIFPLVSFIYDEADQFIPQLDKATQPGMKNSRETAEQLARRGRKYGLGVGIATQRIVYLDTNILGQPHTYFVSKLPRATDRETIQSAFGLSDETLTEAMRFKVGQWLLISHNATGIDGLPIPVQLPDANKRISEFLENF